MEKHYLTNGHHCPVHEFGYPDYRDTDLSPSERERSRRCSCRAYWLLSSEGTPKAWREDHSPSSCIEHGGACKKA